MTYGWHDLAGNVGVALIVLSYAALQLGRIEAHSLPYSLANVLGSGLILLSLAVEFNLSAAVVEAFWLAISAYGLARDLNRRSRPTSPPGP